MAITTTWSVNDMTHKDSDGGVFLVYWSLTATDGTYSAQEGGKLQCTADPSASDYIAYASLKESDLLSGLGLNYQGTPDELAAARSI